MVHILRLLFFRFRVVLLLLLLLSSVNCLHGSCRPEVQNWSGQGTCFGPGPIFSHSTGARSHSLIRLFLVRYGPGKILAAPGGSASL